MGLEIHRMGYTSITIVSLATVDSDEEVKEGHKYGSETKRCWSRCCRQVISTLVHESESDPVSRISPR